LRGLRLINVAGAIVAALIAVGLYRDNMHELGGMLQGAYITLLIVLLSSALALLMAFTAGICRVFAPWPLRGLSVAYIEIFRGTALLVQLFWIYFVLPFMGIKLSLGLNIGAYGAEVVRSAIIAVPKVQWEACKILGLPRRTVIMNALLPQALPMMVPTFGNLLVELLKYSAVVSLISVTELTAKARDLGDIGLGPLVSYSYAIFIYLVLALILTSLFKISTSRIGLAWRGRSLDQ
jgi:polar amino acid transport system permease protein